MPAMNGSRASSGMKIWVILGLLSLTVLVSSYEPAKSKKTRTQQSEELDELAGGDRMEMKKNGLDPNEYDDDDASSKENYKSKSKGNNQESAFESSRLDEIYEALKNKTGIDPVTGKQIGKFPEDEIEEEREIICDEDDKYEDKVCECSDTEVVCDKIVYDDEEPLSTANLEIKSMSKNHVTVKIVNNKIKKLRKGKILPKHQEHIQELVLTKNHISQIEDEAFGEFKSLKKLYLSDNSLKSITKGMFANMDSLHQLYLDSNYITKVEHGSFSGAKNLKKLILDSNKNIVLSKETFKGLDNLEELSLDGCGVKEDNFEADLLQYLPNLKRLSLRGNTFTKVPSFVHSLSKLEDLDISKSNIAEFDSSSFKDDFHLKTLRAEEMEYLYEILDCTFCGMEQLKEIHMSKNKQLYSIKENAFGYAEGSSKPALAVEVFNVEACNISVIPEKLMYWDSVKELLIGENPIVCNCETAFLLEGTQFQYTTTSIVPKCASPPELAKKPLPAVQKRTACARVKTLEEATRTGFSFGFLLILVLAIVGGVLLYQRGLIQSCIVTAKQAFPPMSYSNLANNPEDGTSLQNDFHTRPESV